MLVSIVIVRRGRPDGMSVGASSTSHPHFEVFHHYEEPLQLHISVTMPRMSGIADRARLLLSPSPTAAAAAQQYVFASVTTYARCQAVAVRPCRDKPPVNPGSRLTKGLQALCCNGYRMALLRCSRKTARLR